MPNGPLQVRLVNIHAGAHDDLANGTITGPATDATIPSELECREQ
ncbi:hypothetical protein QA640_37950 [Bradyrhizobium sp. CB82]|nr:hypothetical protein [Bradyrhizobium sp. CB82]WFU39989.1 hypothetical protein QA640_37950 [Bradyrhizobium sp. CB82]